MNFKDTGLIYLTPKKLSNGLFLILLLSSFRKVLICYLTRCSVGAIIYLD